MSDKTQHKGNKGVLKKAHPAKTRMAWSILKGATIVGRAARTEEDVSAHDAKSVKSVRPKAAKRQERRWRHCSTLPFKPVTAFIPIQHQTYPVGRYGLLLICQVVNPPGKTETMPTVRPE